MPADGGGIASAIGRSWLQAKGWGWIRKSALMLSASIATRRKEGSRQA